MLEIGAGNYEEHAVLLCNYLLAIESVADSLESKWRSHIVLGDAVPDGHVVWVLRRHINSDATVLINPCTVRGCLRL